MSHTLADHLTGIIENIILFPLRESAIPKVNLLRVFAIFVQGVAFWRSSKEIQISERRDDDMMDQHRRWGSIFVFDAGQTPKEILYTIYWVAISHILFIIMVTFFQYCRPHAMRSWCKIVSVVRGEMGPEVLKLDQQNLLQLRSLVKHWIKFRYLHIYVMMIYTPYIMGNIFVMYQPEFKYELIFWALHWELWVYFSLGLFISTYLYFFLCCEIIKMKFTQVTRIVDKSLQATEQAASGGFSRFRLQIKAINYLRIQQMTRKHLEACQLMQDFNEFWSYYLLLMYVMYIPLISHGIFTLIYIKSYESYLKYLYIGFFIQYCISISLTCLTAAQVKTKTSRIYYLATRIAAKYRFQKFHQTFRYNAMLGQHLRGKIGFRCYDYFVVSYETYLQMILMIVSGFTYFSKQYVLKGCTTFC